MFPITEASLPLLQISDYWSRVIDPPASQKELLALLEGAWWLGEINGDSVRSRLELLKRMFTSLRDRADLGIVFTGSEPPDVQLRDLPDGSLILTVRHQIPLPSDDPDSWTEASCAEAFRALAQTPSNESYPEITPGLAFIKLTHDEFVSWLQQRGYDKPNFWKPAPAASRLGGKNAGRPSEYNWPGVSERLQVYAVKNGPALSLRELLEKCADFASELHPRKSVPDDSTIRKAIRKYALDSAAGLRTGK